MNTAQIIKTGLVITGLIIMALTFFLHAMRKLTVNLAVVWEFLGLAAILVGAVPAFSGWCYLIAKGTAIAMFTVGGLMVWGGYQLCILISSLSMKNQELAMQVSLLNQENEKLIRDLRKLTEEKM